MNWPLKIITIRLLVLLNFSLLCLHPIPVRSADEKIQFYDVEIIIFKNNGGPKDKELIIPASLPPKDKRIFDLSSATSKRSYRVLQSNQLRLHDHVKKIAKSPDYDLLTHVGWRQPGLELKKTIPVWIRSGRMFDQAYELEGKITVALARYLHIYTDLVLHRRKSLDDTVANPGVDNLDDPATTTTNKFDSYHLKEHRRMRSKKLHYLDHPEFGLLVMITPYPI